MIIRPLTAAVVIAALFTPVLALAAENDASAKANSTETYVKDSAITTKVKTKLAAEKVSSLAKIHVDTDNKGMVVLTGTAENQQAVDKAATIARDTEGVTSVQNNVKVKKDD
jgi:hyperosmotically inducible protein